MFGNFSTKKVWTQVYQHEVTKTLVNADQLPPTTVTLDKVMELPAIILPERYLVSLQMDEENKVFFSPTEIGTRLSTVCMGKIGYPNSTWERGLLETIKGKTKKILENSNDHAKRVLAEVIPRRPDRGDAVIRNDDWNYRDRNLLQCRDQCF